MITINPLQAADLAEIADIHVRIWQEAYIGQVHQSYLDNMQVAKRLERWQEGFNKNSQNPVYGTLLARVNGKAAGFISYGPARCDAPLALHEIYAVNILQEYIGQGLGKSLFAIACDILKSQGANKTYLWVLSTNTNALQAYQKWGGTLDKSVTKEIELDDHKYLEYAVIFNKLP